MIAHNTSPIRKAFDEVELRAMAERGMSFADMARALGRRADCIGRAARKFEIEVTSARNVHQFKSAATLHEDASQAHAQAARRKPWKPGDPKPFISGRPQP